MAPTSGRFADFGEERHIIRAFLLAQQASEQQAKLSDDTIDELLANRLKSEQLSCRCRTLSSIIREYDVERIDLLKLDVEKSELDVLAGIEDEHWNRIRQIALEVHNEDGRLARISELLEARGFDLLVEQDEMLMETSLYNICAVLPGKTSANVQRDAPSTVDPERPWVKKSAFIEDLRQAVQARLPYYMIPSAFVVLESLPLTPNGKVDRRALPPPGSTRSKTDEAYIAPRSPLERALVDIWANILLVERFGVRDNFFALGGDSLQAIQVLSRLRSVFLVEMPLHRFFAAPSVAELGKAIVSQESKPGQIDRTLRLLEKIRGMSASEKRQQLEERRAGRA